MAVHSEQNLLAAGHDSGMTVFKLERERPAFDVQVNKKQSLLRLSYHLLEPFPCGASYLDLIASSYCLVEERYLRMHEFSNSRDIPLVSLRRTTSNAVPGSCYVLRVLCLLWCCVVLCCAVLCCL